MTEIGSRSSRSGHCAQRGSPARSRVEICRSWPQAAQGSRPQAAGPAVPVLTTTLQGPHRLAALGADRWRNLRAGLSQCDQQVADRPRRRRTSIGQHGRALGKKRCQTPRFRSPARDAGDNGPGPLECKPIIDRHDQVRDEPDRVRNRAVVRRWSRQPGAADACPLGPQIPDAGFGADRFLPAGGRLRPTRWARSSRPSCSRGCPAAPSGSSGSAVRVARRRAGRPGSRTADPALASGSIRSVVSNMPRSAMTLRRCQW